MSDKQRSTSQARRKHTPGPCKHTPGPWKTELRKDSPSDIPWYPIRNLLITAGTREYKINCNCAVDLANARLMAAAPEMLRLIQRLTSPYMAEPQYRMDAFIDANEIVKQITQGDD